MNRVARFAREVRAVARIAGPAAAVRWYFEILRRLGDIVRQGSLMPADPVMSQYPWLRVRVFGREMVIASYCFGGAWEMYGRLFQRDCGWLRMVRALAMEVHPAFSDPAAISSVLSEAGFLVTLACADLTPTDHLERVGYFYACR